MYGVHTSVERINRMLSHLCENKFFFFFFFFFVSLKIYDTLAINAKREKATAKMEITYTTKFYFKISDVASANSLLLKR